MMVCSLAPRSASWVPTVCLNLWAEMVPRTPGPFFLPPGTTSPTSMHACWIGVLNK